MHIDARTLEADTLIEGDLCIIGAGAAGLSIALEWVGRGQKVIVLEGGGFNIEERMQALYRGEALDRPYYPLQATRLHFFGGTTNHWAGWSSPYDPIDFEKRDWVAHSGWPITRAHLDPFYVRAQKVLELGAHDFDAAYWEKLQPGRDRLPLDGRTFFPKMWQFSPPTRMGTVYRDTIVKSENVHLYTYAKVMEIVPNEAVTAVESLRVKTIDGQEHKVRAKQFITACSAIHNARLLLASNSRARAGLGNDHDLVGRFFMEHFEIFGAQVVFEQPQPLALYMHPGFGAGRARAELALTSEAQRQHQVLNGTASLSIYATPTPRKSESQVKFPEVGANPTPQTVYRLFTRQEQEPNRDSRVVLGDEKDELGMPRANLRLNFTRNDKRSIRVFYELLGQEMGRTGLGRLQILDWLLDGDDNAWPTHLRGGWHHMGTARMHADPKQGVVDPNCKVHGLANLYVAGSDVYPTSGAANPTLTLVSLALRLSDHLKNRVLV